MGKLSDLSYSGFKKHIPKDIQPDPKLKVNMEFLHVHYVAYTKASKAKDHRTRINNLRQMVAGIKKSRASINGMYDQCQKGDEKHDKFKLILVEYLELMRDAEKDRQKWIKEELKAGHNAEVDEILTGPGLDKLIPI